MVMKRYLVIAVLCTFFLTSAILTILPVGSQADKYNPWLDIDDSGRINILDCILVADAFGSSGTPIDKTALLDLENRVQRLESGFIGQPAFDSGWIQMGTTGGPYILEHNLDTINVVVYAYFNASSWYGLYSLPNNVFWCNLTETTIWVYPQRFDPNLEYDQFRIMMWKITQP